MRVYLLHRAWKEKRKKFYLSLHRTFFARDLGTSFLVMCIFVKRNIYLVDLFVKLFFINIEKIVTWKIIAAEILKQERRFSHSPSINKIPREFGSGSSEKWNICIGYTASFFFLGDVCKCRSIYLSNSVRPSPLTIENGTIPRQHPSVS